MYNKLYARRTREHGALLRSLLIETPAAAFRDNLELTDRQIRLGNGSSVRIVVDHLIGEASFKF